MGMKREYKNKVKEINIARKRKLRRGRVLAKTQSKNIKRMINA